MAENKQSFVLYADQYELFKRLPNEQAGELIKHIFAYVNDENPETDNLLIQIAFEPIKAQLKRDLKRWEQKIEARSRAGKASAEAKKANKEQQTATNSTYVDFVQQTSTKSTDNVNVNVNGNVNVNDNNTLTCGDKSPSKKERDIFEGKENFTEAQQDEFDRFNAYIETNLPDVRKIKKQISITQYYTLKKLYGITVIMDKLAVIQNTPKYHTGKDKKADVYLTVNTWAKNYPIIQKSNTKNHDEPQTIRMGKREAEALGLIPKEDDPNA